MISDMRRAEYTPEDLPPARFAGLIKHLVVPRPIAWVSSISADGVENLAPHSFFTMASEVPPVAQFTSIGHKDSLRNVRETGEFVISLASEPQFEQINASATEYPPEISEFEALGIEREPAASVRPSRVADSPAALECRLLRTIEIEDSQAVIVLGRVVHVAVAEEALVEGRPAIERLAPLSRLGGIQWALLGEIREIERIPYRGD
jgi:flavin reductase (DIM6/NTAB) family NADH-FMN oxidoreductase RutF